jgi:hypothetical protein
MSNRLQKQMIFSELLPQLINYINTYKDVNYEYHCVIEQVYRPPELAKLYAEQKKGVAYSVHELKCAADLSIFRRSLENGDWHYLTLTEDYKFAGDYWVSIGGVWGGNFSNIKDGNHFSIECEGRK